MKATKKTVIKVVCCVVAAAAIFGSGYATSHFCVSKQSRTYEWIVDTINKNYYKDVDNDLLIKYAMTGGVTELLDIYSAYYTKEEYQNQINSNSGKKSGVGISYSFVSESGILINSVVGNSPAYKAGLKRGSFVEYGIDSNGNKTEFTSSSAFSSFINARNDGEEFTLGVCNGDQFLGDYTLAKSQYTTSYAYMCTNDTSWYFGDSADKSGLSLYENKSGSMNFLPENTAYINLSQFYGTAAQEISVLLSKFNESSCSSLILDLRENGGGYVSVMQQISNSFTADYENAYNGVAMYAQYKSGKTEEYKISPIKSQAYISNDVDVFVLANANTASASEALIGVLISYGVIDYSDIYLSSYSDGYVEYLTTNGYTVKNRQTYGKGIMQSTFTNALTGEALKLTTAEIFWPNGTSIHGVGLTEGAGCNVVSADWSVTYGDEELIRASQTIAERISG